MSQDLILWPVLAQILLVIMVYVNQAMTQPASDVRSNTNSANPFELPTVFYVVCIILWVLNGVDTLVLTLSWVYVASRVVHALVYISSNHSATLHWLFSLGLMILLCLFAYAAWYAFKLI